MAKKKNKTKASLYPKWAWGKTFGVCNETEGRLAVRFLY